MIKAFKWIAPIVAIGVFIFIVLLLVKANSTPNLQSSVVFEKSQENLSLNEKKSWIKHFATRQTKGFYYPVNEIVIKSDLTQKSYTQMIYKLNADVSDPYEVFCIEQEIKSLGLEYAFAKNKKSIELLIFSKKYTKLNTLVSNLKKYSINAQINEYKEDKVWKNIK